MSYIGCYRMLTMIINKSFLIILGSLVEIDTLSKLAQMNYKVNKLIITALK